MTNAQRVSQAFLLKQPAKLPPMSWEEFLTMLTELEQEAKKEENAPD